MARQGGCVPFLDWLAITPDLCVRFYLVAYAGEVLLRVG